MKVYLAPCVAILAALTPMTALADDPGDPAMHSAAARARDHAATRRLNLEQLSMTRKRDAAYAQGWQAASANRASAHSDAEYARSRAAYEQQMAQWRRAVAACQAGDYAACAR